MSLESIASKFELPLDGALFIIVGSQGAGKSSIVKNPSLTVSGDSVAIEEIQNQLAKFLTIEHRSPRIVLDEINPRFYKTDYFKTISGTCKETSLQLFIIVKNLMDLPPLIRTKADYWFVFKLDNTILGFPPLNQLASWSEPEHDPFTAIVAQFSETAKPEIWWYNSARTGTSNGTKKNKIKITKNGKIMETTNIAEVLGIKKQDDLDNESIKDLERRIKQFTRDFANFQENINAKFERIFKSLADLDTKMESIMYDE